MFEFERTRVRVNIKGLKKGARYKLFLDTIASLAVLGLFLLGLGSALGFFN